MPLYLGRVASLNHYFIADPLLNKFASFCCLSIPKVSKMQQTVNLFPAVEVSNCLCGSNIGILASHDPRPDSECNSKCVGNRTQRCGAANRLSVYLPATAVCPNTDTGTGIGGSSTYINCNIGKCFLYWHLPAGSAAVRWCHSVTMDGLVYTAAAPSPSSLSSFYLPLRMQGDPQLSTGANSQPKNHCNTVKKHCSVIVRYTITHRDAWHVSYTPNDQPCCR